MGCQQNEIRGGPLFVRRNASDDGSRPLEPCGRFWECPNVWVEGGVDAGTAQVGREHRVRVRINALPSLPGGATAIENVEVQVWVSNLSIGVGPNAGLPSAGGTAGLRGFVDSIPAGGSAIASCGPWTPVASDAAVSGGHVCIAVNLHGDAPDTGQQVPPQTYTVADGSPRLCCDSHLAQRNVAVVPAPAGQMNLNVEATNPGPEGEEEFEIGISEGPAELPTDPEELTLLATSPLIEVVDPGMTLPEPGELKVLSKEAKLTVPGSGGRFEIHPARGKARLALVHETFGEGLNVNGRIAADERTPLVVAAEFESGEEPGAIHTVEVVQRTAAGVVVGGLTVHAVLTE